MFLLYNGEYQEIDIPMDYNNQQILNGLEVRKSFLGRQIGDFEIVTVDYDWGQHKRVNIARCVCCGKEKEIPNLRDFDRGKGAGRTCACRYNHNKKTPSIPIGKRCREQIGQTIAGFKLIDYREGSGARVECVACGKQKWVPGKTVLAGNVICDHKVVRNYSDPEYIGKRVGNLTVVERVGKLFRIRCDCGTETVQRPTDIFRVDSVKSCGRPECPYHKASQKAGAIKRKMGVAFEKECATIIEMQGFPIEMTPETGDFGVDFFATVDGERVAFQCKKQKIASVVSAVQEVYAGGRFYDCCKFVVVSPSGFSYPAELMASKLGVQLETNLQNFKLKSLKENKIDTQRIQTHSSKGLLWEIDGVTKPAAQWCAEYGVSRNAVLYRVQKGKDLKSALTQSKYSPAIDQMIEIDGIYKSKKEWCDHYGISPQLYDYRIKYSNLSPIEALTKEKAPNGRKKPDFQQLCWNLSS